MKIIGAEEALATGATKGKTATAHYVFNNGAELMQTLVLLSILTLVLDFVVQHHCLLHQ